MEIKYIDRVDPEYIFTNMPESREFFIKNNIFWLRNRKEDQTIFFRNDHEFLKNIKIWLFEKYDLQIITFACEISDERSKENRYWYRPYFYFLFQKILDEKKEIWKQKFFENNNLDERQRDKNLFSKFFEDVKQEFNLQKIWWNFRLNQFIQIYLK